MILMVKNMDDPTPIIVPHSLYYYIRLIIKLGKSFSFFY